MRPWRSLLLAGELGTTDQAARRACGCRKFIHGVDLWLRGDRCHRWPPAHCQNVVTILSEGLTNEGDNAHEALTSALRRHDDEVISAVAAAQSARVVVRRGYANGW